MLNILTSLLHRLRRPCPPAEDLFDFVLDGLEPERQARVREHLANCPACCEQIREYAWVSEGIALSVPQFDPPPDLLQRVQDRIRQDPGQNPWIQQPRPSQASPLQGWALFWMRLGPVFAALSLVMTLVALVAILSLFRFDPADPLLSSLRQLSSHPQARRVALTSASDPSCRGEIMLAEGLDLMLVRVEHLKPCRRGRVYTVWQCGQDGKVCRLAGFQTEDERPNSFLLRMAKPYRSGKGPVILRISLEEAGNFKEPLDQMHGPVTLEGRYEL